VNDSGVKPNMDQSLTQSKFHVNLSELCPTELSRIKDVESTSIGTQGTDPRHLCPPPWDSGNFVDKKNFLDFTQEF
jgi:hypothetical protein